MGSHVIAAYGILLLSTLMASVEPALAAQQASPSAPSQRTTSADPPATVDVDKLPISLDRIRERLGHEPAFSLNLLRALNIPVFRIEQRSDLVFKVDPSWWTDDDVGSYVRPTVNRWHYDFMKMTNPNLPTGYGPGTGVDVLPSVMSAIAGIRHAAQARERAHVRQQIQDELRDIDDARRKAGLPPVEKGATQPASQAPAGNTGNSDPTSSPPTSSNPNSGNAKSGNTANGTSTSPQPTIRVTPPPTHPPDPPDPR